MALWAGFFISSNAFRHRFRSSDDNPAEVSFGSFFDTFAIVFAGGGGAGASTFGTG
jgi:hypothetical protein